ncbi:MAG: hypothetical protein EXR91_10450 [Gemmatimonadetes bacterium]|nr:hypothetical protein [Gemmatimonadota bacterium]
MLKKSVLVVALAVAATLPDDARAQAVGIGGRVGTLGLGGEVALGLGERVVVRGGMGLTPIEPSLTLSGIDVTFELPTLYNVGVDVYLNGAMRIGGGLLFKSDDPSFSAVLTDSTDVGSDRFSPQQIGTLVGVLASDGTVPYVLIGFGRHTTPGIGLFVDFGVALMGEPNVQLSAEGGTLSDDAVPLRTALDQEAAQFEDDAGSYLKFWPILSLGLGVGIG